MSESISSNELRHYGVVGMKWGIRRAKKNGTKYKYTSHATKVYGKKAAKAAAKGDKAKASKYEGYRKRSEELDRKKQDYASKMSTGKAAAHAALTALTAGGYNSRTYSTVKAASGNSKFVSRGLGIATSSVLPFIGDMPARALYVRGYDNNYAKKQIRKVVGTSGR